MVNQDNEDDLCFIPWLDYILIFDGSNIGKSIKILCNYFPPQKTFLFYVFYFPHKNIKDSNPSYPSISIWMTIMRLKLDKKSLYIHQTHYKEFVKLRHRIQFTQKTPSSSLVWPQAETHPSRRKNFLILFSQANRRVTCGGSVHQPQFRDSQGEC